MIVEEIAALLACIVLLIACYGFGRLLISLHRGILDPVERVALTICTGAGILGGLYFLIGMLRFDSATIAPGLAAGILLAVPAIRGRPWRALRAALRQNRWVWFAGLVVLMLALSGLALPAGDMGHDGISYHLLGPKAWLADHRIHPLLDHSHTAFPATIETLFGMLMSISNPRAPGVFGAAMVGCLLGLVWGLSIRLFQSKAIAGLAMAIVAAMPAVMGHADEAFIDVPFAAFALAALRLTLDADVPRVWLVAALCAGFTMGSKYTGVFVIVACAIVILLRAFGARDLRTQLGRAVVFAVVACLVGSPWYLRNWIVVGSPIYPAPPVLSKLCVTPYMSPEATTAFHHYIAERGRGCGKGPLALLALPFTYTFRTNLFHGAGGIGIVPLAFAPLGIWLSRRKREVQLTLIWTLVLLAVWFVTQQEARFAIPMVCALSILAASGLVPALAQPSVVGRVIGWLVLLASLGYGSMNLLGQRVAALKSVVSAAAQERRLRANVPYLDAFRFLNSQKDVGAVLILSKSCPPYYLNCRYVKIDGPYGEHALPSITSAQAAIAHLDDLHVTHVLDVTSESEGFAVPASTALERVFDSPTARVYRKR
jgi:hypothetical protein